MATPNVVVLFLANGHNHTQKGAAMNKGIAISLSIQREIRREKIYFESAIDLNP
jgi:hypothetical protein